MSRKFNRTIEDFTCQHCNTKVKGNGYTNHCPSCLWSKHVDANPGDRQAACQGMMKPIGIELKAGEYHIFHKCLLCGHEKKNKASKVNDQDILVRLSRPKI